MKKRLTAILLALFVLLCAVPVMDAQADEPGITYFTVRFGNFEAMNLLPIATGETAYQGTVPVFDFLYKDKTYGLFVNYDGSYSDVADRIFYDEESNDLILGVTSTSELKKFCVELHTGSTGTMSDSVRVAINSDRYAFDDDGRVYFKKVPTDMIFNVDIAAKLPTKTYKRVDKSKTYNGSCKVDVKNYYSRVVLKGDDPGIKKINKALKKMSDKFLKDGNVHEYASEQVRYGTYDDSYEDYCAQSVTFVNNDVVSIFAVRRWYAGGVSNTFYEGYVYSLKTGNRLKRITDFTKETNIKKLRKTILKKMVKAGELEELAKPEINKLKANQFSFVINKNGSVEVFFGPYTLGHGGWSTECTVAGKYKK